MIAQKLHILHNKRIWIANPCTGTMAISNAEKVIKLKIMNKNKRHIGLKMSSIETLAPHILTVIEQ